MRVTKTVSKTSSKKENTMSFEDVIAGIHERQEAKEQAAQDGADRMNVDLQLARDVRKAVEESESLVRLGRLVVQLIELEKARECAQEDRELKLERQLLASSWRGVR